MRVHGLIGGAMMALAMTTALAMAETLRPGTFAALLLIEPVIPPPPYRVRQHPLADLALKRRRSFRSQEEAAENFSRKSPFAAWHPEALAGYLEEGLHKRGEEVVLACTPEDEAAIYRTASAHGVWRPSATVTTSNATFDFCSGARVCAANAGFCDGALGERGSTPACCATTDVSAAADAINAATSTIRVRVIRSRCYLSSSDSGLTRACSGRSTRLAPPSEVDDARPVGAACRDGCQASTRQTGVRRSQDRLRTQGAS